MLKSLSQIKVGDNVRYNGSNFNVLFNEQLNQYTNFVYFLLAKNK